MPPAAMVQPSRPSSASPRRASSIGHRMEAGEVRDRLASERTHLANERTLLAYVRTALALAAGGAALLEFLPSEGAYRLGAWALVFGGAALAVVGALRFLTVRRRLRA